MLTRINMLTNHMYFQYFYILEAEAEKKPKKVEKLQQKKQAIAARREIVSKYVNLTVCMYACI